MPNPKVNCVLIVDDDNVHNYVAEKAIKKAGIAEQINIVRNGKEAIDFIVKYRDQHNICPSMIFLDVHMPVMDGLDFIEAYNKLDVQKRGTEGAIAIMSASPERHTDKFQEFGIKAFIEKPLTANGVLEFYEEYKSVIQRGTSEDKSN